MQTEPEQIKALLTKADRALAEYKRYRQQASDMACCYVLPFLRDTAKCRVEVSAFDWHPVHILSKEAWAELLTFFNGHQYSQDTIPLDNQIAGACLRLEDDEVSLYMNTPTLGDHKIPVDIGPSLEHLRKRQEGFLNSNAGQAEKFTNLPGAYVHEEEETGDSSNG